MFKVAFNYASFAFIAIAANIFAQDMSIRIYHGIFAVPASVLVGTAIGLIVKFMLDKRFIFNYHPKSHRENGKAFLLYSVMGIVTTVIFWGFEFGADYLFNDKWMRYVGGIVGLVIGYLCKYHLDKRFVFRDDIQ